MKKILIDARMSGKKHAGIGRYVQELIANLAKSKPEYDFHLIYSHQNQLSGFPKKFKKTLLPTRHYTLREQLLVPRLINQINPDLIHFPHFNVPLGVTHPFVVTIHDLLWHQKIGLNATTLPALVYLAKYLGYRLTVKQAIRKSQAIITPTQFVKKTLVSKFPASKPKIFVTHEGVNSTFFKSPDLSKKDLEKLKLSQPFVIYTGSLYPHKNVNTLIDAVKQLPSINLAIISARDAFLEKTQSYVVQNNLQNSVKFLGFIPDNQLIRLYQYALALIQPSVSEGFGLTGLEAMAAGLPVICSPQSAMKEVYGQAALFTNTLDSSMLATSIVKLKNSPRLRRRLVLRGKNQAKKFSWKKMAQETVDIYKRAFI